MDQSSPVSIQTATFSWSVSAEREGCVLIPSLTKTDPWSLSWGAPSASSVSPQLDPRVEVLVEVELLFYHGFDDRATHVVWNNESVPNL